MLVVGTLTAEDSSSLDESQFLGLPDLFLQHHHVPLLDTSAVLTLLGARNIQRYIPGQASVLHAHTRCNAHTPGHPSAADEA